MKRRHSRRSSPSWISRRNPTMVRSTSLTRGAAAILTLTALAACSERPTEIPRLAAPSARSSDAAPGTRYLVLARNNGFANDFASTVASLGGTLETIHQDAGFAVVSGLTDAAA